MPEAVRVRDARTLEKIYRLRVDAWSARVPSFPAIESWSDKFDANAHHWAVLEESLPIAAARLTVHSDLATVPNAEVFVPLFPENLEGPIAVLTRLVVAPKFAGRGLSRLLDEKRIFHAAGLGCRHVLGSTFAGQKRQDSLKSFGFQSLGEPGPYHSGPLKAVAASGSQEIAFILRQADLNRLMAGQREPVEGR